MNCVISIFMIMGKAIKRVPQETGLTGAVSLRSHQSSFSMADYGDIMARANSSWPMEDLEIDLPGELSNSSYGINDALATLSGFKQEIPSPTSGHPREQSSPSRAGQWSTRQQIMLNSGLGVNNSNNPNANSEQSPILNQPGNINQQGFIHNNRQQNIQLTIHSSNVSIGNVQMPPVGVSSVSSMYQNGMQDLMNTSPVNNDQNIMEVGSGLITSTTNNQLEMYSPTSSKCPSQTSGDCDNIDSRFQYILAAATSIATKCNEDTLTYLNQCQPYEIKFKKLGDLSFIKGKLLKSIIRICFHERRLQFAEREQMSLWQSERPGERIVEVDLPLSYGVLHINQPSDQSALNMVEIYWDPTKEVGVFIKINCISTEFTAKKHGGEKGVPFRIQIETFIASELPLTSMVSSPNNSVNTDKRIHAAACQIKVFKLKGADRKHKQDREKAFRRPPSEKEKYQPSYACTIFTDLPSDAVFVPMFSTGHIYSPEHGSGQNPRPANSSPNSPANNNETVPHPLGLHPQLGDVKHHNLSRTNSHGSSLDCDDDNMCKNNLQCTPESPPDLSFIEGEPLLETTTPLATRAWLSSQRFPNVLQSLGNFSGSDLLRLSRDDLIQICGISDGIRLFNLLHAERSPAKLIIYVRKSNESNYTAIFLRNFTFVEFKRKLYPLLQEISGASCLNYASLYISGPNDIKIRLTDEVIQNLKPESLYQMELLDDGGIILKPAV